MLKCVFKYYFGVLLKLVSGYLNVKIVFQLLPVYADGNSMFRHSFVVAVGNFIIGGNCLLGTFIC